MVENTKIVQQARILIVEDSLTQAMRLQYTLEMAGFLVTHADEAKQAVEFIRQNIPDLVISDIVMPDVSGYMLCKQIRSNPIWARIPVILLTTLSEPGDVIRGLECGANGFVSKPYQENYLLARVNDVLENSKLHVDEGEKKEVKFNFSGQSYHVVADRMQILEVLISTYSTAMLKNDELVKTQEELQILNNSLEQVVQARTVELQGEIDERKKTEIYLQAQYKLSQMLAESLTLDEVGKKVFSIIRESSQCDMCGVWYESHHTAVLHNLAMWIVDDIQAEDFVESCKETNFQRNVGYLGKVWANGKPQSLHLDDKTLPSSRVEKAYRAGMKTWLAIPIVVRETPMGIMEFYWRDTRDLSEQLLMVLSAFSMQVGAFVAREFLQQQFLQAQKMESVGQLTGGIAHDFNNLLMIIQGNLELLSSQIDVNENITKYINTALTAVERGSNFNKQLLSFSRKQMLKPRVVEVKPLLVNTINLMKPILGDAIEINVDAQNDLYHVYIDPGQFENAVVNLSINARDAMNNKGHLTFEAKNVSVVDDVIAKKYNITPGEYVKISVSDTGSGIPADLLDKVFDPFFTTKSSNRGTGLGLCMVYGFMKQSKGHVTIYSELNQGTTINLYLPHEMKEIAVKEPEIIDVANLNGHENILVVEDEEALRGIVVEYLLGLGYKITQIADAQSALEILKSGTPIDLLLTDIVTHGSMMGTQLAEQALRIHPQLKVLFTSGYPKNALRDHPELLTNADNFLAKPYKIQELGVRIRQLLARE